LLAAYTAPDLVGPPNYSLWLEPGGEPLATGPRALNLLYRARCVVARHRSPGPIVRALLGHLDPLLGPADSTHLQLRMATLLSPDGAVLVPAWLTGPLGTDERRLAKSGLRLLHGDITTIDANSGHVLVGPPRLDIDQEALHLLGGSTTEDDGTLAPGQYPLAVLVVTNAPGHFEPISRARAVALAAPTILPYQDNVEVIQALGTAIAGARTLAAGSLRTAELLRALSHLD
jgi:hypothetical protein